MNRRTFLGNSLLATGLASASGMAATPLFGAEGASTPDLEPFKSTPSLDRARVIPGALMYFHVRSQEAGGQFALMEGRGRPGMEPRPHTHTREDESVYLLGGEVWFRIGETEIEAKAGDLVFMPRGIEHEFKIRSDDFHCLLHVSPGGLDELFWRIGAPATSPDIPPVVDRPPSPEQMQMSIKLNAEFGILPPREG